MSGQNRQYLFTWLKRVHTATIPPPTARESVQLASHELNEATGAHSGGQSKAARGPDLGLLKSPGLQRPLCWNPQE